MGTWFLAVSVFDIVPSRYHGAALTKIRNDTKQSVKWNFYIYAYLGYDFFFDCVLFLFGNMLNPATMVTSSVRCARH